MDPMKDMKSEGGKDLDMKDFLEAVMNAKDYEEKKDKPDFEKSGKMGKGMDMKHGMDMGGDKEKSATHLLMKMAKMLNEFCGENCGEGMGKEDSDKPEGDKGDEDDDEDAEGDKDEDYFERIANQLMQAISLIDTHTDSYLDGKEEPEGALDAIDSETSRLLWGKQDENNKLSSYQNANYGKKVANGFMMDNPATSFNKFAFDDEEEE